jgi:N-acetylneuraminic acid mutarotase
MKIARSNCGSCSVNDRAIYICGGISKSNQTLNAIEFYNIFHNTWEIINTKLPEKLYGPGAISVKMDEILIIGGISKMNSASNHVFSLNLNSFQWKNLSKLNKARQLNDKIFYIDGRLYVCGGSSDANDAEVLDRREQNPKWKLINGYEHILQNQLFNWCAGFI